jgi:hypothetical protein
MPNITLCTDEWVVKSTINNWLVTSKGGQEKNLRTKMRERYISPINQYQSRHTRVTISSCIIATEPLPLKFKRLLAEWRKQTAHLSSIKAKVMVVPYLEIIGMGQPALRLILNELKERPVYLFPALRAITGIDPVQPEDKGKLRRMANAWIEWGRRHNII